MRDNRARQCNCNDQTCVSWKKVIFGKQTKSIRWPFFGAGGKTLVDGVESGKRGRACRPVVWWIPSGGKRHLSSSARCVPRTSATKMQQQIVILWRRTSVSEVTNGNGHHLVTYFPLLKRQFSLQDVCKRIAKNQSIFRCVTHSFMHSLTFYALAKQERSFFTRVCFALILYCNLQHQFHLNECIIALA